MADAPAYLLDALDMITASEMPAPETLALNGEGHAEALHIRRVRDVFEDRNIVAVGISEKVTDSKRAGVLSLCFYVETKVPKTRIKVGMLVPPVVAAPGGRAVFTDVKAIGRIKPEVKKRVSPIQSGFSVGHIDSTAGTVGAIVQVKGKAFILSNSHVLAKAGLAALKDKIVYPGPFDKGTLPQHLVGALAKVVKFKTGGAFVNDVDAALCVIDASRLDDLNLTICGLKGKPSTTKAARDMKVVKCGRTTGRTEGIVQDVNFRTIINYPGVGQVGFMDQVLCSRYTQPGDSGSLVVDKLSGKIVGLHFAGSSEGSIFNPIDRVMTALGFTFKA